MYIITLTLLNYLSNYSTGDYYFYGRKTNRPVLIINPKHKSRYNADFKKIIILPL